ncbi:hypothetical protein BLOT_012351 [Blomia tropicalis]|nr:hypothetical protein BLOT_012351 [Blomia tropicalis]
MEDDNNRDHVINFGFFLNCLQPNSGRWRISPVLLTFWLTYENFAEIINFYQKYHLWLACSHLSYLPDGICGINFRSSLDKLKFLIDMMQIVSNEV